jgi:NADP-dependent 3-hydroxy acid dehydrogenase YdfG
VERRVSEFAGQVAIVTGAGGGIGGAISRQLAAHGATVCLVGRKAARLEAVARSAGESSGRFVCCPADLTVDAEIEDLRARIERECGGADIVVHSAGVISLGRLDEARVEQMDWHYRVNVRASYALTCALLPWLKARRGQVVFMNSTVGLTARAGVGQYAATKHALRAIADSLRDEVNPDGVRVLSVFLGRTASPMQADIHRVEGRAYDPDRLVQPDDVATVVLSALRLPRTAEVTEIRIRPMRKAS